MEPIGWHISELLFEHDCVIVPALGGFLASNESARMLPNRMLYPPYRRIAFNVYLKQNDGLLANHLVETENITYSAANSLLEEFTYDCIQNLEQGKKVNIDQVGTLYFDHERNIQFEAFRNINHRKDSFGLEPVQIVPVQHETVEVPKKVVPKPAREIRLPAENKRPLISSKGKRYIGVAAAVAALVWFGANFYLTTPKKYEATSLNPFDSQISVIPTEPLKDSQVTQIEQSADTQSSVDTTAIAENRTVSPDTVRSVIVAPAETTVTPPEREPENRTITGPKKYVIAGVFKIRENAVNTLAKLQTAGFKNARIIESNGLNYVSYSEFDSSDAAMAMADSLRKNKLEGWIWNH